MTETEKHEAYAAKRYLYNTENEHYRVFWDNENPQSAESNYAVLKADGNVQAGLAHIELHYAGSKIQPKIWSRPDSAPLAQVKGLLTENGWQIHTYKTLRMTLTAEPKPDLAVAPCEVRIFEVPLPQPERSLLLMQCDSMDYEAKAVDRAISLAGANAFVAYNPQGMPVSICVGYGYGSAYQISDVYTLPEYRQQGYATAVLLDAIARAYRGEYQIEIFLDCDDANVQRLYEALGFRGEVVDRWWAVKGHMPMWLREL